MKNPLTAKHAKPTCALLRRLKKAQRAQMKKIKNLHRVAQRSHRVTRRKDKKKRLPFGDSLSVINLNLF